MGVEVVKRTAKSWQALLLIAWSAVVTGCTVTTVGRGVAAPTLGHAPRPLPASALSGLLLDNRDFDAIMGARLEVVDSRKTMYTNAPLDDGCLVWAEAQDYNYQGSGWTAMREEVLKDRRDNADHIAYQAVIAFPEALGANNFYAGQVTSWSRCDNRRVDLHDPGDTGPHYWELSKATARDGVLTITRTQENGRGWACQRALTAANNIVIDVSACADDVGQRGAEIAQKIAGHVPTA